MSAREALGVELDERGFLTDPQVWNEDLASRLAGQLDVGELGEEHWKVLRHVREHNLKTGAIPAMEQVCHHLGLDRDCVRRLFRGPLELWKVAGLAFPGTEAFTYMQDEES